VGLIFALSTIPIFSMVILFGTSLRIILWIATVLVIWLSRVSGRTLGYTR